MRDFGATLQRFGVLAILISVTACGSGDGSDASGTDSATGDDAGTDAAEIPTALCPGVINPGNNDAIDSVTGELRSLILLIPAGHDPGQSWPLMTAWHWLGGTPEQFISAGDLQGQADAYGFLIVAPRSRGLPLEWDSGNLDPNQSGDVIFFDEIVACMVEQYGADPDRIYATGMSAGGLFTSYLGIYRSSVLAAYAPASGGLLTGWESPAAKPPVLVIWGGPTDTFGPVNFHDLAVQMIGNLRTNDQFVAACNHGTGHTLPPSATNWITLFFRDHPRGVLPEPYSAGLPGLFPAYCEVVP